MLKMKKMRIVEDEEDEDEDDDIDASGGAFGSHYDIDFNFLHNK